MSGGPYLPIAVLVPLAHVFATEDDSGDFKIDAFDGGFDLTFGQLDAGLVGECVQCGAVVDHRRGVDPGDDGCLPIDIATLPPSVFTRLPEPFCVTDLLDSGWTIGPRCNECRLKDRRKAVDALREKWRREGKFEG